MRAAEYMQGFMDARVRPLCAGPGMVPLALAAMTHTPAVQVAEDLMIEQAVDDDSDAEFVEQERPDPKQRQKESKFDQALNAITVLKTVSSEAHQIAAMICALMTQLLAVSEFIKLCSKLCSCNLADLINYDVMEYSTCEHRRVLTKPRKRKKRALLDSHFCRTHRHAIVRLRRGVIKFLKEKHPHQIPEHDGQKNRQWIPEVLL
jgi:hypothetical protein